MTDFSPWLSRNLDHLTVWFGALCTLGLYSVLYRENKIYRLFEHIFLGLATGFLVANTWTDVLRPKWWIPMWDHGRWWFILLLVAGSLYFFIYFKKVSWIARLVIGFYLGVASGQAFQVFANDTWPQIPGSFKPLIPHVANRAGPALTRASALNNLIFVLVIVLVMSYFFFSFEQRHVVLRGSASLGRWVMMFAFGAIFGSTIMARLALLIDRMYFLIHDCGATMPGPSGNWIMFYVILALAALLLWLAARSRSEYG